VLVWDDEVEVTPENIEELTSPTAAARPGGAHQRVPSAMSLPGGRRRSVSFGRAPAPPLHRLSTDSARPRPVPFARSRSAVHPATTGVAVLEQMEQLDAVERRLQRLGPAGPAEPEESDVGDAGPPRPPPAAAASPGSPRSPRSPRLPPVAELVPVEDAADSGEHRDEHEDGDADDDEVDLAALSKSTSQLEIPSSRFHARWTSAGDAPPHFQPFDMFGPTEGESPKRKIAVVEVSCLVWGEEGDVADGRCSGSSPLMSSHFSLSSNSL
jgi:hypothetical protein